MKGILAAVAAGVLADFVIVAALITATVRIVAGFWPKYPRALLCSIVLFVLSLFVVSAVQSIVGKGNGWAPTSGIMLVLNAVVVNGLIKRPDGTSIGIVWAGLASLIQLIFQAILLVAFIVALGLSFFHAVFPGY